MLVETPFVWEVNCDEKGVDYMTITYLKKIMLTLALLFLLQGCAFYVRGHDEYHEHYPHHYYHGYWR